MRFSVVIPVYNRPEELSELLQSMCDQVRQPDEVLVVEDGSSLPSQDVVEHYADRLPLQYFAKENEGQGMARNYGFERANGDYFVVFDSDTLLPPAYFHELEQALASHPTPDAHGGPDAAHADFTAWQKAINYAMTGVLTTGGIRGRKNAADEYLARSFNMGFSRQVWQATGGFREARMGEDIELSRRIKQAGFRLQLLTQCFVYHKRRTNLRAFFRQVFKFGQTRIMLWRKHKQPIKLAHWFPLVYVVQLCVPAVVIVSGVAMHTPWLLAAVVAWGGLNALYLLGIALLAAVEKPRVNPVLGLCASVVQLLAYGLGFAYEFISAAAGRKQR